MNVARQCCGGCRNLDQLAAGEKQVWLEGKHLREVLRRKLDLVQNHTFTRFKIYIKIGSGKLQLHILTLYKHVDMMKHV